MFRLFEVVCNFTVAPCDLLIYKADFISGDLLMETLKNSFVAPTEPMKTMTCARFFRNLN